MAGDARHELIRAGVAAWNEGDWDRTFELAVGRDGIEVEVRT